MTKAKALLLAARPKTLPAAVCPVIAGSALAWRLEHTFSWLLAVATLLSTLAIQVATNYFNDAVDSAKGADTKARLGPVRATAAGLVSRKTMLLAGAVTALVAAAFSVPLVMERGWPIVLIGVVSLFFSYGYTGGPWPLAYRGLGEVFVMLFFGLVAVTGTVFVQTGHWHPHGVILGVQVGALSTALIAINNLRDIAEDTRTGKRTLAVRAGKKVARLMIAAACLLPYAVGALWLNRIAVTESVVESASTMVDPLHPAATMVTIVRNTGYLLSQLYWIPLPAMLLGLVIISAVRRTEPSPVYNKFLALAGVHLLAWTLLFTAACVWG